MLVKANAKINLCLDVTGRRPDGYHFVRMIMQSISLHDDVLIEKTDGGIALSVSCPGISKEEARENVPADSSNLMYRAAALMQRLFGISCGFSMKLVKRIPVAAGMAGGSADAAAVILGINDLCGLKLSTEELCAAGAQLGADIPFCILGGTALAEGIGEKLTAIGQRVFPELLIIKPDGGMSTPAVYRGYDAVCSSIPRGDFEGCLNAVKQGDLHALSERMFNVLEPVTAAEMPVIRDIERFLIDNGAVGAMMSGSGPTVFGMFESDGAAECCRSRLIESRMGISPENCLRASFVNPVQDN